MLSAFHGLVYYPAAQLTPLQMNVIATAWQQQNCLIISTTGSCKSSCNILPCLVFPPKNCVSLIILPTVSLINDIWLCSERCGAACEMLYAESIQHASKTAKRFLLSPPEAFQNHNIAIKHLNNKIDQIIVDKVHFMVTENDFHSAYNCVREYLACSATPIMLFTATLPPHP